MVGLTPIITPTTHDGSDDDLPPITRRMMGGIGGVALHIVAYTTCLRGERGGAGGREEGAGGRGGGVCCT